jgi:Protein of unknown function (DUF2917)
MILDMKRLVIELEHRGIVPIGNGKGARIDCVRGRIWITEHEETSDIVLEAGESYEISRSGVAVVQALREALVVVWSPTVSTARVGLATRVERLRNRWIGRAADGHPAVRNLEAC